MKLYQFESCPYCKMVREALSDLEITYININVPRERSKRQEVFEVSKQWTVPVLVDGDVMLDDEEKILPYLAEKYGK
ncbi:glutathione S-transferase N-terminal domain-containing protein [bacterium]|nr:glutathione S-transferase N-terminal domain-containing protein [bacterium]